MKYKIEDINFAKISPKAFENLCYVLPLKRKSEID